MRSLLTIVHLSKVGMANRLVLILCENKFSKERFFNSYDLNGSPVDKNQSAASYAIAALVVLPKMTKSCIVRQLQYLIIFKLWIQAVRFMEDLVISYETSLFL